jgi:hypothetical protein
MKQRFLSSPSLPGVPWIPPSILFNEIGDYRLRVGCRIVTTDFRLTLKIKQKIKLYINSYMRHFILGAYNNLHSEDQVEITLQLTEYLSHVLASRSSPTTRMLKATPYYAQRVTTSVITAIGCALWRQYRRVSVQCLYLCK